MLVVWWNINIHLYLETKSEATVFKSLAAIANVHFINFNFYTSFISTHFAFVNHLILLFILLVNEYRLLCWMGCLINATVLGWRSPFSSRLSWCLSTKVSFQKHTNTLLIEREMINVVWMFSHFRILSKTHMHAHSQRLHSVAGNASVYSPFLSRVSG